MKNIITILFLICSLFSFAQSGKVIKVKDGDTVVVLDDDLKEHTIRVADIDCPEKGQPFGKAAKLFTSNLIFGKNVTIKAKNQDRFGRTVGYIIYDNKDLSLELLKNGLAWHYKYYSDDQTMSKAEAIAKRKKLGLWADKNPINPYNWRKGER